MASKYSESVAIMGNIGVFTTWKMYTKRTTKPAAAIIKTERRYDIKPVHFFGKKDNSLSSATVGKILNTRSFLDKLIVR
jgi:hypothetical protein